MILTYKFRIKDSGCGKILSKHAAAVNFVWNFCVDTQKQAERRWKWGGATQWLSAFDLIKLCTGVGKELGLHSDTVQFVCRQFVTARDSRGRCPKHRRNFGHRHALGWVPFIKRAAQVDGATVKYLKRKFKFWKSREIHGTVKDGMFVRDSRGRWYVCFRCEVLDHLPSGSGQIGIDLGLKKLATMSDGKTVPVKRHYRKLEQSLAVAQRAGNRRRAKAIHAKIANSRRHHLHEWSAKIARENKFIAVGDINPTKLGKTHLAKSVYDASWTMFRNQLRYKASRRGAVYVDVDERFTSQTCSRCGAIPDSSPKGMGALGIRYWECTNCGTRHNRDVNAARNILRVGLERQALVGEISGLRGEDVKRDVVAAILSESAP